MNSRLLGGSSVVLAVLAVSIGIFIYNSAQATITDSITSLSTQEIVAFNENFVQYEGLQRGEDVDKLIKKMISNARTYYAEKGKVPGLVIEELKEDGTIEQTIVDYLNQEEPTNYINALNNIEANINFENEYYVELTYQRNGLIDYIHVSYDFSNPITDVISRE